MENLFASFSHPDSVAFLLSVLISFLIGFITAWILWGSRASRYKKEAAKWKKSYDELTLEHNSLKEQFDLKEADLVKAQREAEETQERYHLLLTDKAKWQSDLDAAMEETVRLHASIHSYQATIEDLNSQILGLKARNAHLTEETRQESLALDQVAQMQSSYNATLARLGSLEEKINKLAEENAALRSATVDEDEQMTIMRRTYDESVHRLAALESSMNALMEENHALKAELIELKDMRSNAFEVAMPKVKDARQVEEQEEEMLVINPQKNVLAETIILPDKPPVLIREKDDLKIVEGIGPKIELLLNEAGINTWQGLAEASVDHLKEILRQAGDRYRMHDPYTWPEQAKLAARGEWEKLKEYQEFLSGGRDPGKK